MINKRFYFLFLDRPIRCYQPRDAGYHDTNMRYYNRWYYHPDQDTCHLFVYRGLGGNENNFQTLHECHSACISKYLEKQPPPHILIIYEINKFSF
jgi:hypothetical protein